MGVNRYAFESGDTDIHLIPKCTVCKRRTKCVVTRDGLVCHSCRDKAEKEKIDKYKLLNSEYRAVLIKHYLGV